MTANDGAVILTGNGTYNIEAHILHGLGVVYETGLGPSLSPACCSCSPDLRPDLNTSSIKGLPREKS